LSGNYLEFSYYAPVKSVFSYTDFRRFLADHYSHRKRARAGFSFRAFTKEAKVRSPNYLKLVIDGERALTTPFLFRFARAAGLDHLETQYFESLVHFNQASDKLEKDYYRQRLAELKARTPAGGVRVGGNRAPLHWYSLLVQLLLEGKQVETAEAQVRAQLGPEVPVKEISAQALERGALAVEEGRYVLKHAFTDYRDKTSTKVSFEEYIKGHLRHVLDNFSSLYPKGKFVCHSFTISRRRFEFYRSLVTGLILEINQHAEKEKPEELIQLNVQLYPFQGEIRP
jgi:uncharacterized protein (TIGR02147 family)